MVLSPLTIGVIAFAIAIVLLHFKTSRADGTLVPRVHPYRRMMPFIMVGRNESVVFFDTHLRAEPLLEYLEEARADFGANMTHAIVAACAVGVAENPAMNQFVVGKRYYNRTGRWMTFSMKRVKKDRKAKLGVVKMEMPDGETFRQFCDRTNSQITHERSGVKTGLDKELSILGLIPRTVLNVAIRFVKGLDYFGLLPGWFIRGDGMYTSVFVANLGSVGMGAGYHHLYEWGTCGLFVMVGRIEERPVVQDGEVVVGKVLHIRYSYDERIDDGLTARHGIDSVERILRDPRRWLGCLASDEGADQVMWPREVEGEG